MKITASERTSEATASEIEARAARWLERRQFGIWNDDAQAEFDAWMN